MIKETHIIRGTIYSLEELAEIADGVRVREREEKEMTKTMEKAVGRIYEELAKWCAERNVIYEYNFSTDEGESCTFITPDTTLTVNHVECRDPEQFSKYVKSVLFGVDESAVIDKLKEEINKKDAYIGRLEKEDIEKAKDIVYLEDEVKKLRDENAGLKYQLDIMNTKILDLNDTVSEGDKNLRTASDKIIQITCANTSLKGQIDGLRLQLKAEREGYGELRDQYDDKCKAFINMCTHYDSEVAKRKKAEYELNELKAGRHDDTVDVTRYLVVLGKKKRAEEKIRSLKSQVEICEAVVKNLADQNESFKKQVDALVKEKLKILAEDDATMDILKKKNETLQYKIDALENDVKDLTFSYKKELEKKEKENLELDNNVKDMWATLRSLRKENAGLKDANSFLSIKLESHNEIIEALKNNNEELKAKIEELLEKNYNLDNHVKNLVAQQEILEREKSELTNEYHDLVKVKEFVKNDTLKDIKERIARILTHMNNAEAEIDKRFKKLEDGTLFTNDMLTGICTRLDKLEDAQPKKTKATKKSQKSTLS